MFNGRSRRARDERAHGSPPSVWPEPRGSGNLILAARRARIVVIGHTQSVSMDAV